MAKHYSNFNKKRGWDAGGKEGTNSTIKRTSLLMSSLILHPSLPLSLSLSLSLNLDVDVEGELKALLKNLKHIVQFNFYNQPTNSW